MMKTILRQMERGIQMRTQSIRNLLIAILPLCVIAVMMLLMIQPVSAANTIRVEGDINDDGVVDETDIYLLARYVSYISDDYGDDINGDGNINAVDLTYLARLVCNPSSGDGDWTDPIM